jgi:uncharacterized protein (UPF0276 family)
LLPLITTGLLLTPDTAWLDMLGDVMERDCEHFEIAPETLWRVDESGGLVANGFHGRFTRLRDRLHRPFIAHGTAFSLGSASPVDEARRQHWLDRIRADHAAFHFGWYTDHLGATALDGLAMALPLPLPMDDASASAVRRSLRALQSIVPDVGVENNVAYVVLGDALDEPEFLNRTLDGPRMHLLLDLHNLHTMAENHGFDPGDYVARLDLSRVIEIHLSGGSYSAPEWLPSGRSLRLDSHDNAVPEDVWKLFGDIAPRCANLRAVTLERMEGTVRQPDAALIADELRRARIMVRGT